MICTLGDLLLDVIVRASEPAAAEADTAAETRVTSGGQAANVASWVAELGEPARFIGKQADDAAGALVRSLLERRGVELVGGASGLGETAVVKRGSRGVVVLSASGAEEHAPAGAEVIDTTGAGDALAAGFIVGGIELGLEAAARCVSQLGAVPV